MIERWYQRECRTMHRSPRPWRRRLAAAIVTLLEPFLYHRHW